MASFAKLVVLRAKEMADFTTYRVLDRDLTPKAIEREAARVLAAHTDVWGGGAATCPEWVTVHIDADLFEARHALFTSRDTRVAVEKKLIAGFCRSFRPKTAPRIQVQFVPDDSLTKGRFSVAVSWKRPMPTPIHTDTYSDGAMPDVRLGDGTEAGEPDQGLPTTRFVGTTRSFGPVPDPEPDVFAEFLLVAKTGSQIIPVYASPLLIGAGPEVGHPGHIDDDTVSRRHLLVWAENNRVCLHDLGSTNGTRVNGTPTTAGAAKPGDFLRVGGVVFEVTVPDQAGSFRPDPQAVSPEPVTGLRPPTIHGIR